MPCQNETLNLSPVTWIWFVSSVKLRLFFAAIDVSRDFAIGNINCAVATSYPCFAQISGVARLNETCMKYSRPGLAAILL